MNRLNAAWVVDTTTVTITQGGNPCPNPQLSIGLRTVSEDSLICFTDSAEQSVHVFRGLPGAIQGLEHAALRGE